MKFKPSETEIATEREAISRLLMQHCGGKKYKESQRRTSPRRQVKSRINRACSRIMATREQTKFWISGAA
jgi:hypothetical protein